MTTRKTWTTADGMGRFIAFMGGWCPQRFIDGQWRNIIGGKWAASINPAGMTAGETTTDY